MSPLHVHGLDRFVDEVHAQFDAWAEQGEIAMTIGDDGLALLRLAVHEWVANLVQHAEFNGPADLTLSLEVVDNGVRCQIEDTSRGFDFPRQVGAQESVMQDSAPSERGRGLLMLVTCAVDLTFHEASGDHPQRIAFTVGAPGEEMFASLFRPEDLVLDLSELAPSPAETEARGDGASHSATPVPVQKESISS